MMDETLRLPYRHETDDALVPRLRDEQRLASRVLVEIAGGETLGRQPRECVATRVQIERAQRGPIGAAGGTNDDRHVYIDPGSAAHRNGREWATRLDHGERRTDRSARPANRRGSPANARDTSTQAREHGSTIARPFLTMARRRANVARGSRQPGESGRRSERGLRRAARESRRNRDWRQPRRSRAFALRNDNRNRTRIVI